MCLRAHRGGVSRGCGTALAAAHLPVRRLGSPVQQPGGGVAQLVGQGGLQPLPAVQHLHGQLDPRLVPESPPRTAPPAPRALRPANSPNLLLAVEEQPPPPPPPPSPRDAPHTLAQTLARTSSASFVCVDVVVSPPEPGVGPGAANEEESRRCSSALQEGSSAAAPAPGGAGACRGSRVVRHPRGLHKAVAPGDLHVGRQPPAKHVSVVSAP